MTSADLIDAIVRVLFKAGYHPQAVPWLRTAGRVCWRVEVCLEPDRPVLGSLLCSDEHPTQLEAWMCLVRKLAPRLTTQQRWALSALLPMRELLPCLRAPANSTTHPTADSASPPTSLQEHKIPC